MTESELSDIYKKLLSEYEDIKKTRAEARYVARKTVTGAA